MADNEEVATKAPESDLPSGEHISGIAGDTIAQQGPSMGVSQLCSCLRTKLTVDRNTAQQTDQHVGVSGHP